MYHSHPSEALQARFRQAPFQGARPEKARFLFVGLDANYDASIKESPIFDPLLDYLDDGVRFWQREGVHHPFLLPTYSGDGRFYHQSFAKIGFKPMHAGQVSFVELLHLPTWGTSRLSDQDLSRNHLRWLNEVIISGNAEYVFVPDTVGRLMRKTRMFSWMPSAPTASDTSLKLWADLGSKKVLWHYHLSVYGKFEKTKSKQLTEIRNLI